MYSLSAILAPYGLLLIPYGIHRGKSVSKTLTISSEYIDKLFRERKRRRQITWQRIARDMARNPKKYHGATRAELPRQADEVDEDQYTESLAIMGQLLLITLRNDPFNSEWHEKLQWIRGYFEARHNGRLSKDYKITLRTNSMKKTPTIFIRNPQNMKLVLPNQNPVCAWVFNGEGVPTRKYDGTCCRVLDGKLWKRRELKKDQGAPAEFEAADYDETTGKSVGWVPVTDSPEDRWHLEAFQFPLPDGTYELCGPEIQCNPEYYDHHTLIPHAEATRYSGIERTFDGIRRFLESVDIEGLVFHHPDGRMAKIKRRDFGLRRLKKC